MEDKKLYIEFQGQQVGWSFSAYPIESPEFDNNHIILKDPSMNEQSFIMYILQNIFEAAGVKFVINR